MKKTIEWGIRSLFLVVTVFSFSIGARAEALPKLTNAAGQLVQTSSQMATNQAGNISFQLANAWEAKGRWYHHLSPNVDYDMYGYIFRIIEKGEDFFPTGNAMLAQYNELLKSRFPNRCVDFVGGGWRDNKLVVCIETMEKEPSGRPKYVNLHPWDGITNTPHATAPKPAPKQSFDLQLYTWYDKGTYMVLYAKSYEDLVKHYTGVIPGSDGWYVTGEREAMELLEKRYGESYRGMITVHGNEGKYGLEAFVVDSCGKNPSDGYPIYYPDGACLEFN